MATTSRVADILLRAGLVDQLQLRSALAHQEQWGGRLAHIVTEKRFTREEDVVEALSRALRLPRVELSMVDKEPAALQRLDAEFCRSNGVFPCSLKDSGKTLQVAMSDPSDIGVVDQMQHRARARILTVVAGEREILAAIELHYFGRNRDEVRAGFGGGIAVEDMAPDDDEFKIVDMAGKTVMKRLADIQADELTEPPPGPPPGPLAPPVSTSSIDDLFADSVSPSAQMAWTAGDIQRLEQIRQNQGKSTLVFRALLELCMEKGLFSRDEYRTRLKG